MNRTPGHRMEEEIPGRLAEWLALPRNRLKVRRKPVIEGGKTQQPDLVITAGSRVIVVEYKPGNQAAAVASAVNRAKKNAKRWKKSGIPLVAVPYMGEVGKRLCEKAGVGWLDLSGNAHIAVPGLRVIVEGKPNLFKRRGRPRSVFAPKSARIARLLLMDPERAFSQRELAKVCGLDEGFTSRIVRQLEEQGLITRDRGGAVKAADSGSLLDAWRDVYDFSKHYILRGHVAARSGDGLMRQLAGRFRQRGLEYAATGLAAAWLYDPFAGFRLTAFYLAKMPSTSEREALGFHEESQGENVWLIAPNDEGVFQGAEEREGVRCVHPVQAYLDLKDHPERAAEAGQRLREKLGKWNTHA